MVRNEIGKSKKFLIFERQVLKKNVCLPHWLSNAMNADYKLFYNLKTGE